MRWFGAVRWTYNRAIHLVASHTIDKPTLKALRDACAAKAVVAQYPFLAQVPYDVRDAALHDFVKAHANDTRKRQKARRNKQTPPRAARFKWRCRKDQQSLEIRGRDWNKRSGAYAPIFTPAVLRAAEPLPDTIDATFRLIRDPIGRFYICIPVEVHVHRDENQVPPHRHSVIALDPGVRTFQTCYDADGHAFEWGAGDMKRIFCLCRFADKLQSRITTLPPRGNKKHKRRLYTAWRKMLMRIRNKVDDIHRKMAKWLVTHYRVVLIPAFESQRMASRARRKISSKTSRSMMTWSHYRFRQTLLAKSELYEHCKVIVCDEAYTSKTCGQCGKIKTDLGSSKTFRCRPCGYVADRDISAARNILLRYLTRAGITPSLGGPGSL